MLDIKGDNEVKTILMDNGKKITIKQEFTNEELDELAHKGIPLIIPCKFCKKISTGFLTKSDIAGDGSKNKESKNV